MFRYLCSPILFVFVRVFINVSVLMISFRWKTCQLHVKKSLHYFIYDVGKVPTSYLLAIWCLLLGNGLEQNMVIDWKKLLTFYRETASLLGKWEGQSKYRIVIGWKKFQGKWVCVRYSGGLEINDRNWLEKSFGVVDSKVLQYSINCKGLQGFDWEKFQQNWVHAQKRFLKKYSSKDWKYYF